MLRALIIFCLMIFPHFVFAGELQAPAPPDNQGSAMYTLEQTYQRLLKGTDGAKRTGVFAEPSAGPLTPTMHNLNDIMTIAPKKDNQFGASPSDVKPGKYFWGLRTDSTTTANGGWGLLSGTGGTYDSPVQQTGQTTQTPNYATWGQVGRDDAYWAGQGVGMTWTGSGSRFKDNGDGTVTDQMTGLMWSKNANLGRNDSGTSITVQWTGALDAVDAMNNKGSLATKGPFYPQGCAVGNDISKCYLDWRLPNIKEMQSLVDYGQSYPSMPPSYVNVFQDVKSDFYWSSTTDILNPNSSAWSVYMANGNVSSKLKSSPYRVWPVRGGKY